MSYTFFLQDSGICIIKLPTNLMHEWWWTCIMAIERWWVDIDSPWSSFKRHNWAPRHLVKSSGFSLEVAVQRKMWPRANGCFHCTTTNLFFSSYNNIILFGTNNFQDNPQTCCNVMKQFSQTARKKCDFLQHFLQTPLERGVCRKCCQLYIMMTPHNIWGVHSSVNGATPEGYQRSLDPDPHP